ncbi:MULTISPECIES: hypothetical protein [unclassified Bradyrhizobium]|uniref:hypothetical protein n=1 Tax=unclassified Bradyrhizobium TaxID=2631580 RepID=UPI0028EA0B4B|nr:MULTISPECIES: hypothetical protein [unclassified Bradyrhizobium]
MMEPVAQRWFSAFMETVRAHEASIALREAAEKGELKRWTQALTGIVVSTFPALGWQGAARQHKSDLLPVSRSEYLALDVVAFESAGDRRWRFPVGIFELENSPVDDLVAYSLWKVLSVRARLRVVFCYRRDANEGAGLIRHLADEVIQAMEVPARSALEGETIVIIGSRSESATFPYGFFKDWTLDANTARFRRN